MRLIKPRFRVRWRQEKVKRRRRVVEFMAGLSPADSSHFLKRLNWSKPTGEIKS